MFALHQFLQNPFHLPVLSTLCSVLLYFKKKSNKQTNKKQLDKNNTKTKPHKAWSSYLLQSMGLPCSMEYDVPSKHSIRENWFSLCQWISVVNNFFTGVELCLAWLCHMLSVDVLFVINNIFYGWEEGFYSRCEGESTAQAIWKLPEQGEESSRLNMTSKLNWAVRKEGACWKRQTRERMREETKRSPTGQGLKWKGYIGMRSWWEGS